eukprot:CAMPEP_0172313488 /NCGR_PEP_ID=MMETSP1058-20130122/20296_1 /TAXON_ID=83371 /ORGANISM="Detonula confervacea, Strain CCMP 353" /LENGTH=272 /DNA_ID=CAMNT_0013027145 /DNA_START=53 /DNA_END=871 /DNA_ORIENTATION=-
MIARGFASHSCLLSSLTKLLLLCLAGAHLVLSQDDHTIAKYDCVDPSNREIAHVVRRGEITTICLYVGPDGDWNSNIDYKRFSVNLISDEFSSYEVPGSFNAVALDPNMFNADATHIFAASQASLSFLRRYYDKTAERIYPFLTAIIDVQDGVVRGIAWDDACIFCEKSQCVPNTFNFDGSVATTEQISQPVGGCYFSINDCKGFVVDGSNNCDLKLNVVWTGTDENGKVLLSSGSRPSMFPPNRVQENVKGQYDSMVESVNNFKGKITGSR